MTGNIRQRTAGTWTIQWYLGRDKKTGAKRYGSKTVKGSKKDAQKELNRIVHEIESKKYVEPAKITVAQYLRDWLRDYARGHVAGTTYERYEGIVENHLIPALGDSQLGDLEPMEIEKYYTEAQKSGRLHQTPKRGKAKPGLSARSVQQHHAVLRKALKCAVRWGKVARNVCDMVDPPRVTYKERHAFSEEEVQALIRATDGVLWDKKRPENTNEHPIPWGPVILLATSTGMRLGEVLALTWADFDPAGNRIAVTKALEQTRSGVTVKEPKSERGKRNIPIPEKVAFRLTSYKEQLEAAARDRGRVLAQATPICTDEHGEHLKPDSVSSRFRDIVKRAGVSTIGFHSLRHAHATMLAKRGWQAKIIQERLGHSTIAITMDIYSHVLPTTQQEAAESLSDVF